MAERMSAIGVGSGPKNLSARSTLWTIWLTRLQQVDARDVPTAHTLVEEIANPTPMTFHAA